MQKADSARIVVGLPLNNDVRMRPEMLEKYRVFVQSTSANRKLVPGTGFLYEIDLGESS